MANVPFEFSFCGKSDDNILMKFFSERKTPSQNIAFLGIASALNAVFSLLVHFVPLSDLAVLLFLPLVSAMVGWLCEKKYLPIYLVAAVGVSLAVTAYDISATLFYVVPAIVSGTAYGFFYHKSWPLPYVILGTAIITMGLNYVSIPLIKLIYDQDIIAFFLNVLSLSSHPYVHDIIPAFLLTYALAQTAISHFVIQGFFARFHLGKEENEKLVLSYPLDGICGVILTISFAFSYPIVSYVFLVIALYFSAFAALLFAERFPWWVYLLFGLMELGSLYGFALLYPLIPADGGLALLSLFLFSLDTATLLGRLLCLRKGKETGK
jgi:hypothetical protein